MPMMPVLSRVSIDLIEPVSGTAVHEGPCIMGLACPSRESAMRVVAHVGDTTVSNQPGSSAGSFDWTIPQSIPQAPDYQIRVSAFRSSDTSDAGFAITGGPITPSVTPVPVASGTSETSDQLLRMRTQVVNMIQKMQDVLNQINAALQAIGVNIQ